MQILKKEMKLKGLSIKDLALRLNITTSNVHGWISGKFKPGVKMIPVLKSMGFSDTACLNPSKDIEV